MGRARPRSEDLVARGVCVGTQTCGRCVLVVVILVGVIRSSHATSAGDRLMRRGGLLGVWCRRELGLLFGLLCVRLCRRSWRRCRRQV